jgi:hypothetical protein
MRLSRQTTAALPRSHFLQQTFQRCRPMGRHALPDLLDRPLKLRHLAHRALRQPNQMDGKLIPGMLHEEAFELTRPVIPQQEDQPPRPEATDRSYRLSTSFA